MPDQNTNQPADREQTPEEIATLKAGKEDVERRKLLVGQPLPLMNDPMWLLSEEGLPVLAHGLGKDFRGNPIEPRSETVTVLVPKDFTWSATGHHRFLFRQGVREVPASLLDIKWIRDNGVQVWNRPDVPQVQTILGSSSLGSTVKVGALDKPSGPFLTQAYQESGLNADQWNSLSDEERGTRAIDCAGRAGAAQAAQHTEGMGVPGAGAATIQPQPQDRMQQAKPPGQQAPPNKIAPGPPRK